MLKLIQIIRYLTHEGFSRKMIKEMIARITSGEDELFELTEKELGKIKAILLDDKKLEGGGGIRYA